MQNEFYSFRDKAEASDQPTVRGHHPDPGRGFDDTGRPIGSITPNIAFEVDIKNNWLEPEEIADLPKNQRFQDAVTLLGPILRFLGQSGSVHSCGLRAFALVLALRPELCRATTHSEMGRILGTSKQSLSKYVSELFHLSHAGFVRGQNCCGAERREVARRRTTEYHARVGHKMANRRNDDE